MAQELELTAALSTLLQSKDWRPFASDPDHLRRTLYLNTSLGHVTMQQVCKAADLGDWHNHIRVQGYQDATIAEFNWNRDLEDEIKSPEAAWTLIHQVEDRVEEYEAG